jgi:hypothetical protein
MSRGDMVHQPRGRVTIADENGNGSGDYAYHETTKTVRAEIVAEDDPDAVEKALHGLFKAVKKRPINSIARLYGRGCVIVLLGCIFLAVIRKGEPQVITQGNWLAWISPNVWGTNIGYAIKPTIQGWAKDIHNGAVDNEENISARAETTSSLKPRTKVNIQ